MKYIWPILLKGRVKVRVNVRVKVVWLKVKVRVIAKLIYFSKMYTTSFMSIKF